MGFPSSPLLPPTTLASNNSLGLSWITFLFLLFTPSIIHSLRSTPSSLHSHQLEARSESTISLHLPHQFPHQFLTFSPPFLIHFLLPVPSLSHHLSISLDHGCRRFPCGFNCHWCYEKRWWQWRRQETFAVSSGSRSWVTNNHLHCPEGCFVYFHQSLVFSGVFRL